MKKKKLFLCTIFLVALMLLGSLTFTSGAAEVSAANNTVGTVQLRAVNRISSTKVRLTWNKVPQASGYRVYRKTGNSGWKALKRKRSRMGMYGHDGEAGNEIYIHGTGIQKSKWKSHLGRVR